MNLDKIIHLIDVFNKYADEKPAQLVKNAFDTRRINQETDYNPRRNLQYYHRSEPFIAKDSADKLKTFFKLKIATDSLKEDFLGDPDWFDSYARILSSAVDRTLRIEQKDMDFFKPQLDYLEELLYVRYRLKPEDIERLSEKEIRQLIVDKDERLVHKTIYANFNSGGMSKNSNNGIMSKTNQNDNLIDKLFGDVKASKDSPEISRSVTITINDKIVNNNIKKES